MPRHLLFVALVAASASAAPPHGGYDFPPEVRQDMVAQLHVQVADEPDAAGFARVRLTVGVKGPASLEVEPLELGDATGAWQTSRISAWRSAEGKAAWEEALDLRQLKAGLVPIPPIKVRFRKSAADSWQEVEWTNILTDVYGLPLPVVPSPPPSNGTAWLWVLGLVTVLVFLAIGVFWKRARRPVPRTLTAEERTLAALARLGAAAASDQDPREFYETLSAVVRRYVAERFGLPAPRQTTAEFLHAVREKATVPAAQQERLRAFLVRCDLVKFAGVSPTTEEDWEMVEFARTFVGECAKPQ